jgi:Putative peptidoglycan binding domain
MSLFTDIPHDETFTFKVGMPPHLGTYAIQKALIAYNPLLPLAADGVYGVATADRVVSFQKNRGILADGIAGPQTQRMIAVAMREISDPDQRVPRGVIDGLVQGESTGLVDAKNWQQLGGVDLSYVQRRVTYPVVSETAVRRAYDPPFQFAKVTEDFVADQAKYLAYPYVQSRVDKFEYAWRLAVLEHNWPYGAGQLAQGIGLSNRTADWAPVGSCFEDGAPVVTYSDWAKFYSMGSRTHNHRGQMVKLAYGVPNDG